jgi:hypothetical protein
MEEKRSPGQPSLMDPGCETQVSGAQPELTDVGGYVVARIKTTNHTFGQGTSRWCPHGSIAVQSIHLRVSQLCIRERGSSITHDPAGEIDVKSRNQSIEIEGEPFYRKDF